MAPQDTQDRIAPQYRVTRTLVRRRSLWYRVFRENLGLKATSILISLILFWVVREDKGQEVDIEVPVVLSNLSEHEVFVGEMPKVLRVRVRDRWSRLARALERKANPYLVDLRGFSDQTVYVFDADRIRQLLGVTGLSIQSVYPSDFVVRTEPKVERMVPVRSNFVGEPQEGFEVATNRVRAEPHEVRVWGAKTSVRQVNELFTYPVNLGTLDKDVRLEVKIQKPAFPFIFLDDDQVTLHIPVQALQGRLNRENVSVSVKGCPQGFLCRVEPASVRMSLLGPRPVLLKVERGQAPVEVLVEVAEEDATVGKHASMSLECRRPAELECRLSTHRVTLWVARAEEEERPDARHGDLRSRP